MGKNVIMATTRRVRKVSRSHRDAHKIRSGIGGLSEAQVALLKVTFHRVHEFRKAFGRMPKENEPLLFVKGLAVPKFAPEPVATEQLRKSASACRVDIGLLSDFFDS